VRFSEPKELIMPTVKEILVKARELIALPEHWCQGIEASDLNRPCSINDPAANRFCLGGAVNKAGMLLGSNLDRRSDARGYILRKLTTGTITWWNDQAGRQHSEVLAVLDEAIAALAE
jgi:hypothetical protein